MPDDSYQDDAQIIRAAYAERVQDAFKIFAEALATGQGEQACTVRFVRALDLVRKTRDLALRAATQGATAAPTAADARLSQESAEPLSAEDQALVDSALAGTTGRTPPPPPTPRYRG